MRSRRYQSPFLLAVGIGVLAIACATAMQPPPPPPPERPFTEVSVTAVGGEACVTLEPDPAEIWRADAPGRPHQVRWTVHGETSYRWVFEHAAAKGGDDYFGGRVIPCRAPVGSVTSGLPRGLPPGDGDDESWGYRVTLYGCEPGPPEPICSHDPVILIRDVSGP